MNYSYSKHLLFPENFRAINRSLKRIQEEEQSTTKALKYHYLTDNFDAQKTQRAFLKPMGQQFKC